jgi:hypothetical protein
MFIEQYLESLKKIFVKQLYTLLPMFLIVLNINCQDKQSFKEMMLEAESNYLYEEFNEALPIYLKLSKADPSNDNLNFKVGVCYLNIPYEKEKSITYLLKAIKNISLQYKVNDINERQAPLDALFYLGNAYRINNQLDEALKYYNEFKQKLDPTVYDENIVLDQIKAIERAKKLESTPIFFDAKNLGQDINSKFAESNVVVSGDDSTLVYDVKLQFYDALYFSKKINGSWQAPENIIPDLGVDGDVYSTGLSYNGKELFIYRSDNFDGNIYVSRLVNNKWTPIKKLNDNINTKFWESHASISKDGKTLYFTSNRKGGFGGLDIYTATRNNTDQDDWLNVQNIGSEINTPYNEETPFISEDGKILFFSSYSHYNMGGYDIFYSTLLDSGKWSVPLNMGYPMNTTDDDIFFTPIRDGSFAYISRYYPADNYGKTDIYHIELFSAQHPRKFLLKGLLSIPKELKDDKNLQISAQIINKTTHDTLNLSKIDPSVGKFDTKLTAGDYEMNIEGDGIQKNTEEFSIKSNQPNSDVTITSSLKALKKETEPKKIEPLESLNSVSIFDKTFFKVFDSKKLLIGLNLPKGTVVSVNIYSDSTFLRTDKFGITRKNYKYGYIPVPGKNILKFRAITPDNQTAEGEVIIIYEPVTDTISKQELAMKLANKQKSLLYAKNMMGVFAEGDLKDQINKIDIYKENISSIEELADYLKNHAQFNKYSLADVDSLIKKYLANQPKAAKLLVNAISYLLPDSLKSVLDSLINSKSDLTVEDVTKYLVSKSRENDEICFNLLAATSRLADAGSAYYYYEALKKVTRGHLKSLLDTLSMYNEHINSPEELLDYLLSAAAKADYSTDDVYKGFLIIPAYTTSPSELLNSLIAKSDGKLTEFLKRINLNEKQIKTTAELGMLLYEKAKAENISLRDLISLLIKVNSDYYFKQLVDDLYRFSSGKLKELLNSIDLGKENINSSSELLNFILSKATDKEINEDLIAVFSQMASKNLLKADAFKPPVKHGIPYSGFIIALFGVFFVLLIAILLFAFRRNNKENN